MRVIWAKTLERAWQEDKELMRKVRPKVRTNYDSRLPNWRLTHNDLHDSYVQGYRQEYEQVTAQIAQESLEGLVGCIEDFVGSKVAPPRIVVFPIEEYEATVGPAIEKEKELGGRDFDTSVNYTHVFERQNLILMSDRCLASLPVHKQAGFTTIYDKKWSLCAYARRDMDFSIASALALSAIYQLIESDPGGMRNATQAHKESVLSIFKVMGLGELVKQDKGMISLHLLEKIDTMWARQESIETYSFFAALAEVDGVAAAARSGAHFRKTGDVKGDQMKIEVIPR